MTSTTKAAVGSLPWVWRAAMLLISLSLVFLVLWALDRAEFQNVFEPYTLEASQRAQIAHDRYAIDSVAARSGPGIAIIDYDDASVDTLKAPVMGAAIPRGDIADILNWIRLSSDTKPALVFLDVSIAVATEDMAGEGKLRAELEAWRASSSTPVLVVDAGPACSGYLSGGHTTRFVLGGLNGKTGNADQGFRSADDKVIWSCPMFDGLAELPFSCVVGPHDAGDPTIALASPGLIAEAIRRDGMPNSPAFVAAMQSNDRLCRGAGDVPKPKRLTVTFDPRNSGQSSSGRGQIVRHISAADIVIAKRQGSDLQGYSNSLTNRIVVIGSTNKVGRDVAGTPYGVLAGPVIIAEALRSGWIYDASSATPWWHNAIVASGLIVAIYIILVSLNAVRQRLSAQLPRTFRFWVFLILHPNFLVSVVIFVITAFLLANPAFFNSNYLGAVAALFILDGLFVADGILGEWKREVD